MRKRVFILLTLALALSYTCIFVYYAYATLDPGVDATVSYAFFPSYGEIWSKYGCSSPFRSGHSANAWAGSDDSEFGYFYFLNKQGEMGFPADSTDSDGGSFYLAPYQEGVWTASLKTHPSGVSGVRWGEANSYIRMYDVSDDSDSKSDSVAMPMNCQ